MLKAIGKSINIRVSGVKSTKIPIIILVNSPITKSYCSKVDFLKKAGIVQGFISLYPNPANDFIENTADKGFQTFNQYESLKHCITDIVKSELHFFSSMLPNRHLGKMITLASKEKNDLSKAERFLSLING